MVLEKEDGLPAEVKKAFGYHMLEVYGRRTAYAENATSREDCIGADCRER